MKIMEKHIIIKKVCFISLFYRLCYKNKLVARHPRGSSNILIFFHWGKVAMHKVKSNNTLYVPVSALQSTSSYSGECLVPLIMHQEYH